MDEVARPTAHVYGREVIRNGVGFGSALAMTISRSVNKAFFGRLFTGSSGGSTSSTICSCTETTPD